MFANSHWELYWDMVSVTGGLGTGIALTIIVVTLFIRGITWLTSGRKREAHHAIADELGIGSLATVHLSDQSVLEQVRFQGFATLQSTELPFPFEWDGVMILESNDGTKTLLNPKMITRLVILPGQDESSRAC